MCFGSYGRGNRGAVVRFNSARLEASSRLTSTAGSDEFSKSNDPTTRIVPAHPTLQQLSFLAAHAAVGVRRMAQRFAPGRRLRRGGSCFSARTRCAQVVPLIQQLKREEGSLKMECKVKGTESVFLQLPAASEDAATCRLLDRLTFDSLAPQAPAGSLLGAVRKSSNKGGQGKRNQGALFVSPCPAMTWRNL
jgi:hypothetical protein